MNATRRSSLSFPTVLAMTLGLAIACLAARSAAAQAVPYTGTIINETVAVRAGAGQSFYIVGDLRSGSQVVVDEVMFGWYKIVPPEGTYSFVSKTYVDLAGDGKTGKINSSRAAVRAASVNGPNDSYRRQIDLLKGETVQITGEDGNFYKIVPPKGAFVFLPPGAVQPLAGGQAPADTAVKTNPPSHAATSAAPTTQDSQPSSTPHPQLRPTTSEAGQLETSTPSASVQWTTVEEEPAADVPVPSAESFTRTTIAAPSSALRAIEQRLIESQALPLEQQPTQELLLAYRTLAQEQELSVVDKNIVTLRVAQLERNATLTQTLDDLRSVRLSTPAPSIADVMSELSGPRRDPSQRYDARGQLVGSSVYNGKTMPQLFRVIDTTGRRTIAYVRLHPDLTPVSYVGQYVGIVGKSKYDSTLGLDVLNADHVDVISPSAAN